MDGPHVQYARARARVMILAEHVEDHQPIPATPGWTLRDLLAHLAGVASDVAAGNVTTYAQAHWTEAQVRQRRDCSRPELDAEWERATARLAGVLVDPPGHGLDPMFAVLPLLDLVAHQHDLAEAIGRTESLAPATWEFVGARRRQVLHAGIAAACLPALRVVTEEGDDWLVGEGTSLATVRAPRRELWRSLEGRRSRDAVRGFRWSTNPEPYLRVWLGPVFAWPEDAPATDAPTTDARASGSGNDTG